jgi:lactoylglutathione lyase
MEITHVRLLVDEYAACFRFYRDTLGLEPTFGNADSGYADFDTGDVTLALFDADEMAAALDEQTPTATGRDRACVVLRVDDVDETATALGSAGVEVVGPPTDHPEWGLRTVHARDPDGTLVECNEPL